CCLVMKCCCVIAVLHSGNCVVPWMQRCIQPTRRRQFESRFSFRYREINEFLPVRARTVCFWETLSKGRQGCLWPPESDYRAGRQQPASCGQTERDSALLPP